MATEIRTKAFIVDTSKSPHARLRPVAVSDVRLSDPIWEPRRRLTTDKTIPEQHALLESSQRLDNFRRAAGKLAGPFYGRYFNDTDVYKWLEAAAWALAMEPDPALDELVDEVIDIVRAAQLPDGYLDNFYTVDQLEKRWTELTVTHELYCAGHLFQAGVAHYRATGKNTLLDVCCRFADLICDTFGPREEGKTPGTDGHEEVELALVELGRATGNQRYIDQALYFLDARGYGLVGGDEYHQDHVPFRDASEVVGHAVRQVYLTAGATDIYTETGDETIKTALDRLWDNMTQRRIYVSSGIGSRWDGEAFGRDLELGNERAYTESCAAIGSVMWNWRMLLITGDAKYADLIETTLFNAMLPGVSLSGDRYFYQNPLADDGHHQREPWFDCACCPPNIARTLAQLSGYLSTTSPEGIWLHLYAQSDLDLTLEDGRSVSISQRTNYPWDGSIGLTVNGSGEFSLYLRIPSWAKGTTVKAAGISVEEVTPGTYLEIKRDWTPGDMVELDFPMPVRTLVSHPNLFENHGRLAVMRGPLLYCLELAGNDGLNPRNARLDKSPEFTIEHKDQLLGGVTVLSTEVAVDEPASKWSDALYLPAERAPNRVASEKRTIELIPYFAWANREAGPMQVWLRAE